MGDNSENRAIRSILSAGINAIDEDFQSLLSATRRSFRPNSIQNTESRLKSVRGRRRNKEWKKKTFLFRRANCDFFPGLKESKYLTDHGYGYSKDHPTFQTSWSSLDIESYIITLYPNVLLELVGFRYALCNQHRKIVILNEISSVDDLKNAIGQGNLLIVPNSDMPLLTIPSEPITTLNNLSLNSTATARNSLSELVTATNTEQTVNIPQINNSSSVSAVEMDDDFNRDLSFLEDNFVIENNIDLNIPRIISYDEKLIIEVERENIMQQVFDYYNDENIIKKTLEVKFRNETGQDVGGLTKEMFTLFWKQVEENYFVGEEIIVPFLPLHRIRKEKGKYATIGRVLNHSLCLIEKIPLKIAKSVYIKLGNADAVISDDILLNDLLLYVTLHERRIIDKSLNHFNNLTKFEYSHLETFFSAYGLYELPKCNEIKDQLLTIAYQVLVAKPQEFVNDIRSGISILNFNTFWSNLSIDKINKILSEQKATPTKVVNCIIPPENMTNDEEKVFYFLQNYIFSLKQDELHQFLFFVTGSYIMPDIIR